MRVAGYRVKAVQCHQEGCVLLQPGLFATSLETNNEKKKIVERVMVFLFLFQSQPVNKSLQPMCRRI